jgi:ketosteroid isomerase-like protein
MSQENVERYYRVIDAFNRGDLDALLALLDPDMDFAPVARRWKVAVLTRATTGSVLGGRARLRRSPTTSQRSKRYETLET